MKGVPIKFRGKTVFLGRIVYGDLIHYPDKKVGICPIGEDESAEVEPESVAQLVGYDVNGAEVYEGDTLVSAGGIDFTAELWAMGVNDLDADDIGGVNLR